MINWLPALSYLSLISRQDVDQSISGQGAYKGCTAHNHIIPLTSQPDLGEVVSKPAPIEDDLLLAEKGLLWDDFLIF